MVGIPVLAQTRFSQGAAAFGFLISAYGVGNLSGMIVAGHGAAALVAPFSTSSSSSSPVSGRDRVARLHLIGLGRVALLALLGIGNGYIAVVLMTRCSA